ncbi:MAG: peptidylprolyl isomerase [Caulobacter sp.]|jgi:peptidyl-prolyl cis-trans isomerase C|nr:peptidylprolyl isomerase [Caulobacter sp.]
MVRRLAPLIVVAPLLAVVLALAACGPKVSNDKPPETGDVAVARVDGQTIWASDVKREAIAQGRIGEGEPLDIQSELFRQMLDEVVDRELLSAEAIKRGLDDDPVALRRLEAVRKRVLADMVVEDYVEKAVTEENIQKMYREQQDLASHSEQFKARQIVVANPEAAADIKRLLAAGRPFEGLAMERSIDSATRFNGGDFGGFFPLDVMPSAYQAALKDAQPGALVGPFAVEGGWAVVKVDERKPEEPLSLDVARPHIVRFLTYGQIRDLLEKLRGGAKVETLIPRAQVVPGAPSEPANAPPPAPGATLPPATPAPAAPEAKPAPVPAPAPQKK